MDVRNNPEGQAPGNLGRVRSVSCEGEGLGEIFHSSFYLRHVLGSPAGRKGASVTTILLLCLFKTLIYIRDGVAEVCLYSSQAQRRREEIEKVCLGHWFPRGK